MKNRSSFFILFLIVLSFPDEAAWCQTTIDSVEFKLKTAKADSSKIKVLYDAGLHYKSIDPKKAANYLDKAILLAEKANWQKGLSQSYITRGEIYNESGKHDEALKYYNKALEIASKSDNKSLTAKIFNNIGTVHSQKTDYVKAAEFYSHSLKLAEDIGDKDLVATGLLNLGIISFKQNDFKKSHHYKLKALRIYEQEKNWNKVAQTLNGIGINYQSEGKITEAKKYLYKALEIYKREKNRTGVAILYSQIAILYEPDYQKIIDLQLKSKKIWDEINPTHYNAMVNLGNLGYTYLMLASSDKSEKASNLQKAEQYIKDAIQLARTINNKEFDSYFTGTLAEVQEQQGDFKNAYFNFKRFHETNDSIYSQEVKNKISNIQGEREIALRDKQIELSNLRIKEIWLYAIIAGIIIILVFVFLLYRYRLNQLRLKASLEKQKAAQTQEALILKNKATESELKAIRSQMNPHFIFNVLNNIESYILDNDAKTASRLVQKFAMLNRLILENSTQSMVTISREWKALKIYTELEAIRFNNQFNYTFEADEDLDMDNLLIPPMLVQPLVENAIHHGLRNSPLANRLLSVKITQDNTHVIFTVNDNGIGPTKAKEHKKDTAYKEKSIGLESIRERLDILNTSFDEHTAELNIEEKKDKNESGTVSTIRFPKVYNEDESLGVS